MIIIIGNYTADVSVGETASPSPTSPEPWCRKDTIRGGRVLDGGDACHVSEGESPAGVTKKLRQTRTWFPGLLAAISELSLGATAYEGRGRDGRRSWLRVGRGGSAA